MSHKPHLTITTLGPYNSGKSTLCGHLLYQLGALWERGVEKLKCEARNYGDESYSFAFYMDTTTLERQKRTSINNTIREFYTNKYHYTLIDTPGHKKFRKNMIKAASQTDVALLVISAVKDEFEQSIQPNGQIVQHLLIFHALGIKQIIVCINKMGHELVNYNQNRFKEIKSKVQQLFTSFDFDTDAIGCIPIDALEGYNMARKFLSMSWYSGYDLIRCLDTMIEKPKKYVKERFKMYIYERFSIKGIGQVVCGKIQQGKVQREMKVKFLPSGCTGKTFSIEMHHRNMDTGSAGDAVGIHVKGLTKDNLPKIGDLMIIDDEKNDEENILMQNVKYFVARMHIQYHPKKIRIGYEVSMHIVTKRVQCKILSIRWKQGVKTIEYPEYIENGDDVEILFSCKESVIIYPFDEKCNPLLRTIIGLDWNDVVMYGKINDNSYDLYNKLLVYGFIRHFAQKQYGLQMVANLQDIIALYI